MRTKAPVHVGILINDGVVLLEAAAVAEALRFANRVADRRGEAVPFLLTFVHAGRRAVSSLSGLHVLPGNRSGRKLDVLVVPGFDFSGRRHLPARLNALSDSIATIRREAKHASIWSICSGAFLTAEAGLLDGRCATTTWWLGGLFANRYPTVKLKLDQAIVEDGALITSGAVAASFQVAVRLIDRMASPELARTVARLMLLDTGPTLQSPFMQTSNAGVYSGILEDLRKSGTDELIVKACTLMAKRMHERFRIETLAERLHVTSRTLLRRFRRATGVTPLAYLQSVRLERARALLETTGIPIKQVMERVGYVDESAFRRLFRRQVGISMTDYRRRFGFRAASKR
ncbi:MAG: GlxA family transcriptional regulator [Sulfurifustis sp.]